MPPERERALVARARSDAAAFGELYDFYLPRIYGFVQRRVGERSVAEDLTATTFERALAAVRRADFRNDAFGGWLYRVAANATVDHLRRGRRLVPLATDDAPDAGGADNSRGGRATRSADAAVDAFAAAIDRDLLRRALRRLPANHRQALVLRFFDDLDADEAAAAMGCSRQTFAVRLHRALCALRAAMAEEASDAA
ncbi:MAG TPA: sigma-70 family RNA polymerase sigma factor [Candidatus Limnocylindrales bacterium]